jgi:3-phosphoshikimate 1-carboxyvinyltransferase
MKVTIDKSDIKGKMASPPSKSQTIRGLMCAALARGESEIINPLVCDDTEAAVEVLGKVGIRIQREPGRWRVKGGTLRAPQTDLFCRESATTLRFMTAIGALVPGRSHLVGGPSLSRRPVKSLVEALQKLKVRCTMEGKTTPPVTVEGGTPFGGATELPGNISSQFISALLLVAPFAEKEVSIRLTTALTSKPYLLMTLRCLRKFGINVRTGFDKFIIARQSYQPARFEVEGDWSSASYFLALGAVSEGIEVTNLSTASLQGDRVILDFLRNMGAQVRVAGNSVTVMKADLKAIHADLSDCIDLLPTMAILAALANGQSEFTGIERARIKESNRVAAIKDGLVKMDIPVTEEQNRLTITGLATREPAREGEEEESEAGPSPETAAPKIITLDSRGDHRIAMAFGILGTAVGGITLDGAESVAKTFPDFWETLKGIGGKIQKTAEQDREA